MVGQQWDGGRHAAEAVKVEDMMLLVDTMLEYTSTDDQKVGADNMKCCLSDYFSLC